MKTDLSTLAFLAFTIICSIQPLYAQDPIVEWDNTIGGTGYDYLTASAQTADGGFILGGRSNSSISADKTEAPVGDFDYWIVKLDASGGIEWQNTIGTTAADYLTCIVQATDGGYLVGGYTTGGISGDKTDPAIGANDYWILKLAPDGSIAWQKTIGGTGYDNLTDILPIAGGGFILSGSSSSGISGNKTEPNIGGYDYWVMKINSTGTIIWQHTIGGTFNDYLSKTIKDSEGHYVLAGHSDSDISGDKTEPRIGYLDYWIAAIDGTGSVVWQNTIGGTGNDYLTGICELTSGGFMLSGYSYSNSSGDKSENSLNYSDYCWPCGGTYYVGNGSDYWIVRTDEVGSIIWENTYMANYEWSNDKAQEVIQLSENKILIAGNANGEAENLESDGGNDYWLLLIDTNGYIIWQSALGGEVTWVDDEFDWFLENDNNDLHACFPTADGGLFVAGASDGLAGNDKTENPAGGTNSYDYWVLKLGPDICTQIPMYSDYDLDGEGETWLANVCELPAGPYALNNNDCDDSYHTVNTSAIEICDGLDNNCNGSIDEGLTDCNPGPYVEWDKTAGNDRYNTASQASSTADEGIISIGSTYPTSTDLDDPYVVLDSVDIEIFKLGNDGVVDWHRIITASSYDAGMAIKQTGDGGYVLIATSSSGISGEKTVSSFGSTDYWIIKLNAIGDIEWQKVFGGSSSETATALEITPDGGYLIAGESYSGISGNKTEANLGDSDAWILKLNSSGDIEWQNTIGGLSKETNVHIAIGFDGSIVTAMTSNSGIGGDKTEICYGSNDYWLLGLNPLSGTILWQNTIGGTNSDNVGGLAIDEVGQIIISGHSSSPIGYDKTEASILTDYWVVKTNSTGSVIWDNTLTAVANDYCTDAAAYPDGGSLIIGYTPSNNGFDKIEPKNNVVFNFYELEDYTYNDIWLIKLDSDGYIEWQNTIGGNMDDRASSIAIGDDGKIFIAGTSNSYASGDKSSNTFDRVLEFIVTDIWENESTEYYTATDFWIVTLGADMCIPTTELCNTVDDDCNGLIDDGVIETITITAGGPITFCQGNSVILSADYSGTSVQWNKNGSPIPGATTSSYTVTTKGNYTATTSSDCGAATSAGIFVVVNKNPSATITAGGPTTFCAGGSVVLTANAGAGLTYQWYRNGALLPGATLINYTATLEGVYKCSVIKTATGCNKLSAGITVTVPCKEGETIGSGNNAIILFPNPSSGIFTLKGDISPGAQVQIYTANGALIYDKTLNTSYQFDLSAFAKGMYFMEIHDTNGFRVEKLILE